MPVAIRRIRPGEGAQLRAVRLAALADTPSAFGSTWAEEAARDDGYWAAVADRRSAGEREANFVAEDDGGASWLGLVGGFRPGNRADAELVSMWVRPPARGRGLGARLVDAVLDWAAGCGDRSVALWVTRDNAAARRLYQRCGFTPTGDVQPLPSDPCLAELRMLRLLGGSPR